MLEGKRQKQVAAVLEKELNDIFQKMGLSMLNGGMVSIASVKITPDLFDARIYLSFFKIEDHVATLKLIEEKAWEIKKELTSRVRHQLRSMPQLSFYIDDTLDYVDKMENLFKEIKKQDEDIKGSTSQPDTGN
ncbi:MAG: 30S ribosome-binding factor RbfA [Sphingobacteriales bacterium]|nr:MAG: 30S ribosome-binding factor RbfA [Sphingobacteriales bacterium]